MVRLGMLLLSCLYGCDPYCFVAGTEVATPDGVQAIEELRPGDIVLGYDLESQKLVTRPVIAIHDRTAGEILTLSAGGAKVRGSTAEHPFYDAAVGDFTPADELAPGKSQVLLLDGDRVMQVELTTKSVFERATTVYNLSVGGPEHNFFADGILVHNKSFGSSFPYVTVRPNQIVFGAVPIGTTATATFVISNDGNAPVTNLLYAVSDDCQACYWLDDTPRELAVAEQVTVTVAFLPTSSITEAIGSVTVTPADFGTAVALTGIGQ